MTTRTFAAVLHKEEDIYVAECPEVGTVSQGYTIEDAIANLKEATELYLEEFPLPDSGIHRQSLALLPAQAPEQLVPQQVDLVDAQQREQRDVDDGA